LVGDLGQIDVPLLVDIAVGDSSFRRQSESLSSGSCFSAFAPCILGCILCVGSGLIISNDVKKG